ncbi:MAG: hypothetical protein H7Z43_05080 [Clostridia bacterium]|nr:hypothetical protein [Deltaproteobacteria bacterium]
MKAVKRGQEVTITDRDEPVAKLVPFVASTRLTIRPPVSPGKLSTVRLRGINLAGQSAQSLLDDSRGER